MITIKLSYDELVAHCRTLGLEAEIGEPQENVFQVAGQKYDCAPDVAPGPYERIKRKEEFKLGIDELKLHVNNE